MESWSVYDSQSVDYLSIRQLEELLGQIESEAAVARWVADQATDKTRGTWFATNRRD